MATVIWTRRAVLAGAAIYSLLLAYAVPLLLQRGAVARVIGWSYAPIPRSFVRAVLRNGPASGILQPGDRILSIDGFSNYRGLYGPDWQVWTFQPGREYRVRFARAGEIHEAALRVIARPDSSHAPAIEIFLFCSLTFTLMGIVLGWQRPELLTARWGWLACQFTGFIYVTLALEELERLGWFPTPLSSILKVNSTWELWTGWCFIAVFPYALPWTRFWRRVRLFTAALCAADTVLRAGFSFPLIAGVQWFALLPWWWMPAEQQLDSISIATFGIAMTAVFIRNYRQMPDPASRRRLELVGGASAFAFIIIGGSGLAQLFTGIPRPPIASVAALPIPICFAYSVIRHRALDLRLAVRRSLQYVLARNFLRVLALLPLGILVARALRNPSAPITSLIDAGSVSLVVTAVLTLEFRDRIQAAIDRWFFRERLDQDKSVRALLTEIARMQSWSEVAEKAPARLMDLFGLASATIAADAVLMLGPKKSEEPLSATEHELLDLVGTQISLVRQKLLLTEDRSSAVEAERQRLAREIHDTVGQGFAGIALYLDAARKTISSGSSEEASKYLAEAGALARKSLQETRQTVAGLREPEGIDLAGRLRALEGRTAGDSAAIVVRVEDGAAKTAVPDVAWHLARIAEEAVANACKHASARRIEVELAARDGLLTLWVRDDGKGFDPAARNAGYGLIGMRERMAQLSGLVEIVSAPGLGTEVRAEVRVESRPGIHARAETA